MKVTIKKPADEPGAAWPAIAIGIFVAFGGILFGYDTGTISGISAMDYWLKLFADESNDYELTSAQNSLIVSILSAGTFFGALSAAWLGDFLGRRLALIFAAGFVFNLGVVLQTISTSRPLFIAGRFFAGLGVGQVSVLVPMYQSETSPKWIRGTIIGAYQLAITIGLFLAAIVNNSTKGRDDTGSYRIPVAIQFLWALVLVLGMLYLPETPRYHIKRGHKERAIAALAKLRRLPRDDSHLLDEIEEIEANHHYELSIGQARYIDIVKGTVGKRLLTGVLLQALQQLSGVNFIFYYGTQYFKRSGFDNPFIIQVVTNTVNVVSTFPGLYFVETMGRRNLLLMGSIGMTVSQLIVASTGTAVSLDNLPAQRAAIAFVCIYIFFFACSWGPGAWVVTAEIFPLKVRAKCLSITTASNWLLNWAIAYSTPFIVDEEHGNLGSKVFFIWGGCCLVSIFFVWFMIYETKGLTLEEVDEMYGVCSRARKSPAFRPTVRFKEVEKESGGVLRNLSLAEYAERKRSVSGQGAPAEHKDKDNAEPSTY